MKSYHILILTCLFCFWLHGNTSAQTEPETAYKQTLSAFQKSRSTATPVIEEIPFDTFFQNGTQRKTCNLASLPANKTICYTFAVHQNSTVVVNHAGSSIAGTSVTLYFLPDHSSMNPVEEIISVNGSGMISPTQSSWRTMSVDIPSDIAAIGSDQAFICVQIPSRGTCYAVCNTADPNITDGTLQTNIHVHLRGQHERDMVDFGVINSDLYYSTHTGYDCRDGKARLFYCFELEQPGLLNISNLDERGILTTLTLFLKTEKEGLKRIDSGSNYPLINNFYPQIKNKLLDSGVYVILSEGGGGRGQMSNAITIFPHNPQGDSMDNPFHVGSYDTDFTYGRGFNTRDFNNRYKYTEQNAEKDVVHQVDLWVPMNLTISLTPYSGMPHQEAVCYVLNSQKEVVAKAYFTINNATPIRLNNLSSGTYYVISEGVGWDGEMFLSISGIYDKPPVDHTHDYIPSPTFNYIRTITPRVPLSSAEFAMHPDSAAHKIRYFDRLGHPIQQVMRGITPTRQDLVQQDKYDLTGNISQQWLPIVQPRSGQYLSPDTYDTAATSLYGDTYPYTETIYERSPLNRPNEVFGAGTAWHEAARSVKTAYELNRIPLPRYVADGTREQPTLALGEAYAINTLQVKLTRNEDNQTVRVVTDKRGNVIFNTQQSGDEEYTTAYVYNSFGDLCFVLPPELTKPGVTLTQRALDDLGYQYRYDTYHHCIAKKLPGADWNYFCYDKAGQQVLSQDGEQRKRGEWSILIADLSGRPILRGIYRGTVAYPEMLGNIVVYATPAISAGTIHGYKISNFPLPGLEVSAINYYDNYDFCNLHTAYAPALQYEEDPVYGSIRLNSDKVYSFQGLQTGGFVRTTDGAECHYTAIYYDENRRPIQSRTISSAGGQIILKSRYDFSGNLLASAEEVRPTDGSSKDILLTNNTYDHTGRITTTRTTLNAGTPAVVTYAYDELGRLIATTQGEGTNAVTTSHEYNIRGWLSVQRSRLFEMALAYNKPSISTTAPSFCGNITEWTWRQGADAESNTYAFSYDALSRLTDTKQYVDNVANDLYVEKGLSYDRNGNILSLQRMANGSVKDNFAYTYTGNQLTTLHDGTDHTYSYDTNGNMLHDGLHGLDLTYNRLNLIQNVKQDGTTLANYSYLADGTKLSATDGAGDGLLYRGSLVYKKQGDVFSLESGGFNSGRFVATNNGIEPYFHVTDHLGSVRVAMNAQGAVVEQNDYYPFGMRWDGGQLSGNNRYRYNGKEEQKFLNLPYNDYGARMADPVLVIWRGIDPLAEKLFDITPYGFLNNNPTTLVDPNGMLPYRYDRSRQAYLNDGGMEVPWEEVNAWLQENQYYYAMQDRNSNRRNSESGMVSPETDSMQATNSDKSLAKSADNIISKFGMAVDGATVTTEVLKKEYPHLYNLLIKVVGTENALSKILINTSRISAAGQVTNTAVKYIQDKPIKVRDVVNTTLAVLGTKYPQASFVGLWYFGACTIYDRCIVDMWNEGQITLKNLEVKIKNLSTGNLK